MILKSPNRYLIMYSKEGECMGNYKLVILKDGQMMLCVSW
jgi:hypothetical protein